MVIEALSRRHDCSYFSCGDPEMDAYLRVYARQNQERDLRRTWVAVAEAGDPLVIGYYTLCAHCIRRESIPIQRLPRYPIPAILLARLAVADTHQGQGVARRLLGDAFRRRVAIADQVGATVLVVDALNEDVAQRLYLPRRFERTLDNPLRLYVPMATIRSAVRTAERV
ncbi:MAG: GNAT family N-acetyltransferase [Armatimonadetes bacterium]|nr:GNAT family N-acetyltransferase [Armatimonadota bacterium]